jgi:hypothetical protein
MNSDDEMDAELKQLGQRMMPSTGFVDRVMERVEAAENPRPGWLCPGWLRPVTFAVAASVLLSLGCMMLVHNRQPKSRDVAGVSTNPQAITDVHLQRSATRWQTVTQREVTLAGDVPAKEVRQQEFEWIRWVDPEHHATFERVVPREGVRFVTMESY